MKKAVIQTLPSAGRYAPQKCVSIGFGSISYDGKTTINVDGIITVIDSIHTTSPCFWFGGDYSGVVKYSSYIARVMNLLNSNLDIDLYHVSMNSSGSIEILRKDGAIIAVTIDIKAVEKNGTGVEQLLTTDYFPTTTYTSEDISPSDLDEVYKYKSYIWLESANPSNAYTYYAKIENKGGVSITGSGSATTTTVAATNLASSISGLSPELNAIASGSVVEVTSSTPITVCDASDTFGNQASSSWITEVQYVADLPKNMGFENAIVKVIGSGDNTFASFWLEYRDSSWKETKQPDYNAEIDVTTMPHILVRNADDTFEFKQYDEWKSVEFGDADSNPSPSFIDSNERKSPVIKDIFFFKNRLGFITPRTVIMSEVGEYGNFWRTTTAAVLDSDHIDAAVDTNEVVSMEFATYLEDSVMLFSDKAQFKLSGGKILSPKDVQISKTSAYAVNIRVRPVFINDKIFFLSHRGKYSALMQYSIQRGSTLSEAVDVTAHVQTYIPSDVIQISASAINNMIFLLSETHSNTIYVYKYYDNGADRVQSAWFKWEFNGNIVNAFSLGEKVNTLIQRIDSIAAENWVIGSGLWDISKVWDNSKVWVMSTDSLNQDNNFETLDIVPKDYRGVFMDIDGDENATLINTHVNLGEWVYNVRASGKDIRGHLKFKTVQISSDDNSQFTLSISDVARNTIREIKSKYTVDRKPMVYGDAKNIRVAINSSFTTGFKINTVSFEGALTKRDKKL